MKPFATLTETQPIVNTFLDFHESSFHKTFFIKMDHSDLLVLAFHLDTNPVGIFMFKDNRETLEHHTKSVQR